MLNEATAIQHIVGNGWPPFVVHQDTEGSVHTQRLFGELSEDQRAGILSCAVLHRFKRGQFLFRQGEPVRHLMWLQSGMVKHTQVSSDGKEVLLRISSCGDVLNLESKLSSCFHTCSARSMERGKALVWEYDQIERLCNMYPQLRRNFNRLLAIQLEELEERFREIASETVARRLAFVLVRLCNQIGRRSVQGLRISITREELAQMTGTTIYTISRLLVRWAQHGFLLADRQKIVVNDIRKLALVKDVETFR